MIRFVSVTGFHRAGKTKVVVAIIRELSKRGYSVGTVKHIPEENFTIDRQGKDTWMHARAGAKVVVSVAPKEIAKIERRSAELNEVLDRLYGLDFVIVEGFKNFKGLARVVVAKTREEALKLFDEFTIACVGAKGLPVPTFNFRQMKELADMVEQKSYPNLPMLNCGRCGLESCGGWAAAVVSGEKGWDSCPALKDRVTITVDGKVIPLNPFVQEFFSGSIHGMVSSLKGVKDGQIEIKVVKHAR